MGITPVLAAVVDISGGGAEGGHVVVDPMGPIFMGAVYLLVALLPVLLGLLLVFYKKKLQHQQILVAMEKGLPISDLIAKPQQHSREINWVRSLSAGIGFIFVGIVIPIIFFAVGMINPSTPPEKVFGMLIIPTVVCGLGLIFLTRGILQKNYEKQK
jgi:membrane protease YdiL (CAAX protease family)